MRSKASKQELAVIAAAKALHRYLHKNVGPSDEWPVQIIASPEAVDELAAKLTRLRKSLLSLR